MALTTGKGSGNRIFIAAMVVVAAVVVAMIIESRSAPSKDQSMIDRCTSMVLAKLKAPSSAQFPGGESVREWEPDGKSYEITGSVDSQNGFGAMVRSDFRCIVQSADLSVTGVYLE